ncbi:hypothetical protein QA089_004826 [Meyerozyma guilliermondii]
MDSFGIPIATKFERRRTLALWNPSIPIATWSVVSIESAILLSEAGTNGPQCLSPTLGLRGMSEAGSGMVIVDDESEEPVGVEDSEPEDPAGGI